MIVLKNSQVRVTRLPNMRDSHITVSDTLRIERSVDMLVQKLFPAHRPRFPAHSVVLDGFKPLRGDPFAREALQNKPGWINIIIAEGRMTHPYLGLSQR